MNDSRNKQHTVTLLSEPLRPFSEFKRAGSHRFLCFPQTEVGGTDNTGWVELRVSGEQSGLEASSLFLSEVQITTQSLFSYRQLLTASKPQSSHL